MAFALGAVLAYLGAALWARQVSIPGPVLLWFPPAGVAIGCLYLRPRLFPALVAAEVLSTAWIMDLAREYGPLGLVINAVVIVGAYHLAGETLRRLSLNPRLRSADDVLVLAFGCMVVGAPIAAISGVLVQTAIDLVQPDHLAQSIALFWVGDVIGCAALTPAIVMAGSAFLDGNPLPLADEEWAHPKYRLSIEYVAPAATALVLMLVGDHPMRFVYLSFVPMVGMAVRHGVAAAALSNAALAAVLTAGANQLVDDPLARSDLQLLMVVLSVTGLLVGAVVSARRDLLEASQEISEIVEATPDLVATAYRDGQIRYLNPVGRVMLGHDGRPPARAFDFLPDEMAADLMREGMRAAERDGTWTGENRLKGVDGRVIPVSQVLIAHRSPHRDVPTYSIVCRDMSDQRRLEDQLRRAALYDDVTGLPNRALLEVELLRTLGGAHPTATTAVMFADVDRLQRVNETFGSDVGDQVVNTVSERISQLIRGADILARYGGAQFAVVLSEVSDEFEPIGFARRLLRCFADPMEIDGHLVRVTGSVGIALTSGTADPREALRSAEIALHRAKEAGGGRFALFDLDLQDRAQQRVEREADLREALESGSWWLAYQPVVDARSGSVTGAEALLRFTHPEKGPVSPFDLVRLAEQSGAIIDLGREILNRACAEATRWRERGHAMSVAVNVSAIQLRDATFVDDVSDALHRSGLPARNLVIELTETTLATDEHGEVRSLAAIRSLGCRVALDDFGTGFSSLSGLRDLPIDVVKLDRSFITDLTGSPRASALVEAVVTLAGALDLTVVAEGVETTEQHELLARLGCDRIQGYLISQPLSPDEMDDFLTAHSVADR